MAELAGAGRLGARLHGGGDAAIGKEDSLIAQEHELQFAHGAVAVLGDLGLHAQGTGVLDFGGFRVEEEHDVGVLFNGAAFAQVGETRTLVGAGVDGARELSAGDDRDFELAGDGLEGTGDLGDFLDPVVPMNRARA